MYYVQYSIGNRYRYWSEYNCLLLTEFQSKVSPALSSQEGQAEV